MMMFFMIGSLVASGPSPEIAKGAHVYEWLIGAWDAEVIAHQPDGTVLRGPAKIHFQWVLEGRAIQDTWIARPRTHGTTLRVYDPKNDVWRITWINPVNGAENRLIGRKVGNDIVQEGVDDQGTLMRWSFREITATSFHWFGETSNDGGATWKLRTEFLARRAPREALWSAVNDEGFEHVRLTGTTAEGLIVRRDYRVRYRIECDDAWRVRSVTLEDLGSSRSLALRSDGDGHWTDPSGAVVTALEGARDVDIRLSPFTNTIAIRRLALRPGAAATTEVAFIDPVSMTAKRAKQRYTRAEPNLYHYEGVESGFSVDLPVDAEGLVTGYPRFFRRAW